MNKEKIEDLWKELLKELGENTEREGLIETPRRIANMYEEVFAGYNLNNKPKLTTFNNDSDNLSYKGMICDKGYFFSYCEHHAIPFFGNYYFAYIPNKKIIGLSKIARVIDFFSAKLQIQERLTEEIVKELDKILEPKGMILVLKARHLCKEMRGAKKRNGFMTTSQVTGVFLDNKNNVKEEFINLMSLK